MPNKFIGSKQKDILSDQESIFLKVSWSEDNAITWRSYDPVKQAKVFMFDAVDVNLKTYKPLFNFATAGTLTSLYPTSVPVPSTDYWQCSVGIDAQKRLYISNVKFNGYMESMAMTHTESVLDTVNFTDTALYLRFKKTNGTDYFHEVPLPGRDTYKAFVGTQGSIGADTKFQAGIMQSFTYYINVSGTVIGVRIDLSFVFKQPDNDFEPLGVIDASKLFPQIKFHSAPVSVDYINTSTDPDRASYLSDIVISGLPSDVVASTASVYKFKGRVKMVANNNNSAHVDLYTAGDGKQYDRNHFKGARSIGAPIPDMFEKIFDPGAPSNIAGFYTDSNMSDNDNRYHSWPHYGAVPPLWSYIFDYLNPDQVEKEINAVWGFQDSSHFNLNTNTFSTAQKNYVYPPGNTDNYAINLQRTARQGQYDNIHLHGYMGKYKDNNEMVLHSPICGFCCFHVHWRWADLNYQLNDKWILRKLTAAGDPDRFLGWNLDDTITSNVEHGGPLVPPNQSLKVAITKVGTTPFDKDHILNPAITTPAALDTDRKAVWYSADILNLYPGGSHVMLEQGVGFAFRYNPKLNDALDVVEDLLIGAVILENPALAALLAAAAPTMADLFEVNYRIMHFFNRGPWASLQQVPNGTYTGTNTISMENL